MVASSHDVFIRATQLIEHIQNELEDLPASVSLRENEDGSEVSVIVMNGKTRETETIHFKSDEVKVQDTSYSIDHEGPEVGSKTLSKIEEHLLKNLF